MQRIREQGLEASLSDLNSSLGSISLDSVLSLVYGDGEGNSDTSSETESLVSSLRSLSDLEQGNGTYTPPKADQRLIHLYFHIWTTASVILFLISCANVDWLYLFRNEPWYMIALCIFFVLVQGLLQWSVLELPLMSMASVMVKPQDDLVGDGRHLTCLVNYNLLASSREEVDATLMNAFVAYFGNLGPSVAACLVSATGDEELKAYELEVRDNFREQIFHLVLAEGKAWADGAAINRGRSYRVFERFRNRGTGQAVDGFIDDILPSLAKRYASDFMVIHRRTRVLRKCGQYQDLMLLSQGDNQCWTYTDPKHYQTKARVFGEPLFVPSEDVDNIMGRSFDYTLVLDGDTGVTRDSISRLLDVAAANPNRAILQPSIEMIADEDQSIFMHMDKLRQEVNEPIAAAVTTLMGRSGFFGKGLIKNDLYIKGVLGTRKKPLEKVPIDVLSHDTFEAGALSPLFVKSVKLLEEPCGNYVTWNIRECRWNRGELILSHYFFPNTLGRLFSSAMWLCRKEAPEKLIVREKTVLDTAGAYIAHSALRQMALKPLLLMFILCRIWVKVHFYYSWISLATMCLLVLVLPKLPLLRRNNWWKVLLEVLCSIVQYSPEPITGTFRVLRAVQSHVTGVSGWVPQFKVEKDFLIKPEVVASFSYQWKLFLISVGSAIPIFIFRPTDFLLQFLFLITAALPIFTTLTALPLSCWKKFFRRVVFVCTFRWLAPCLPCCCRHRDSNGKDNSSSGRGRTATERKRIAI